MALQLWETLKETITSYTGLSPATFFTTLALSWAAYYVLSTIFVAAVDYRKVARELNGVDLEPQPLQPPVQVGEISEEELKLYDGSDPNRPLLMAIKGQIYDVSQSRMFYGPGGPYALFAGKDASRALAKMSFDDKDLTGDISGLGPFELDALQDWEYKFMGKYEKVGSIKKIAVPAAEGSSTGEPSEATDRDVTIPNGESPAEPAAVEVPEPAIAEETSSLGGAKE